MSHPVILEDIKYILSHNLPWKSLSNTTVLVTGANGFVPAYIIETLLNINMLELAAVKVIAVVRNEQRGLKRFKDYIKRPDFKIIVNDVNNPLFIKEHMRDG